MASAADSSLSHEERWTAHRADSEVARASSAASTPAPTTPATPPADDLTSSQELARPSAPASGSASKGLGIDAEDEDVRIAIMALGAMKSLDGKANGIGAGTASGSNVTLDAQQRTSKCDRRKCAPLRQGLIVLISLTDSDLFRPLYHCIEPNSPNSHIFSSIQLQPSLYRHLFTLLNTYDRPHTRLWRRFSRRPPARSTFRRPSSRSQASRCHPRRKRQRASSRPRDDERCRLFETS